MIIIKKKLFICVGFIILIAASFIIFENNYLKIDNPNYLWNLYDEDMKDIKNQLNEIASLNKNGDWNELKDFSINDEQYNESLNKLLIRVRYCYIEFENYENNTLLNYRNKNKIAKKELKKIYKSNSNNCMKNIDNLKEIEISDNVENKKRYINAISKSNIMKNKEIKENYEELLYQRILEVNYINELSEFLYNEYYRLK